MTLTKIIIAVIIFLIAIGSFIISFFQLNNRGFLFNNAYLYASKEEREKLDKKPHYRQSGIVFVFIGIIFLLNAIELIVETGWLFYVVMIVTFITIVYAIVSSIKIEKKK